MTLHNADFAHKIAGTVSFDDLGEELGRDVRNALRLALNAGAVFPRPDRPLALLRQAIADAIGKIAEDARWELFQRFLKYGPQDVEQMAPKEGQLTQAETATVISFIWGHTVNSFQGAITELLATAPCTQIVQSLQREGLLPEETRLYVGDAVMPVRSRGSGHAKGADVHLLVVPSALSDRANVVVLGVGEVKSYFCGEAALQRQSTNHIARAQRGLRVRGEDYLRDAVQLGLGLGGDVHRIAVLPGRWRLPRSLRWRQEGDRRVPEVVPGTPPNPVDEIIRVSDTEWRVVLRWSREALAATAYEMAFWLMSKIGEVTYENGVPTEWSEMTPAQAGFNAAKEKLFFAIRPYAVKPEKSKKPGKRALTRKEILEMQRAIALYNSFGFGYMLGMNFRNREGKREMLWPEDLDEILAQGETVRGCRIV